MNRGEVYWVNFDPQLGSEIQKRRPAVVLSRQPFNSRRRTVVVVPLSTAHTRTEWPLLIAVRSPGPAVAVIDQIKAADKARFGPQMGKLPNSQNREAAAWCALAGGQPLIGTTDWGRAAISRDSEAYFWTRAVQLKQILHAAQNRLPMRREKQFVRYSAPLNSGWRVGIETVNTFGPVWLSAELL